MLLKGSARINPASAGRFSESHTEKVINVDESKIFKANEMAVEFIMNK